MGAVTSLRKGYDAGYQGGLPPYITLTTPLPWFSGPPVSWKPSIRRSPPTAIRTTPIFVFRVWRWPADLTDKRLEERRTLLQSVDRPGQQMDQEPAFQEMDSFHQKAYSMVLGDARKAFDMAKETDEVKEKYGRNVFPSEGACWLAAWSNREFPSSRSTGAGGILTRTISEP